MIPQSSLQSRIAASWRRMGRAESDEQYRGEKETFDNLCRQLAETKGTERDVSQETSMRTHSILQGVV